MCQVRTVIETGIPGLPGVEARRVSAAAACLLTSDAGDLHPGLAVHN